MANVLLFCIAKVYSENVSLASNNRTLSFICCLFFYLLIILLAEIQEPNIAFHYFAILYSI
ncbi:hypothetical protein ACJIZ3_019316 [Penstemon smallii]|uniref:Uncharacterized protein n=1 Tax=Penstemon smallii TaxID=265156 RepID=A0ABD3T0T8_9LAMI